MEPAVWGFIGTAVGAVLAIAGNIVLHATERAARRRDQLNATRVLQRHERKAAYTRLLALARKLRFIARDPTTAQNHDLDALRTEFSTIQYEIELIAPTELVTAANGLRRSTLDYLNASLQGADETEREKCRLRSREYVSLLIGAAREDLRIAPDSWPGVSRRGIDS